MTPAQFKAWRKHLKWSQQQAADALGVGKVSVQNYERGHRAGSDPRPTDIPKSVELACAALALGVSRYDGPQHNNPA